MNLLVETREAIKQSGHDVGDIAFIGSEASGHQCSWDEFTRLADVEYYSGFGAAEVAIDLVIVFSDGQKLWRGEYDGSEWWEFSKPSVKPANKLPINRLTVVGTNHVGWCPLSALNEVQS